MTGSNHKKKLYEIIFEADTPAGKAFDVALLYAILISVLVAVLETVDSISIHLQQEIYFLEWFFTIIFTLEYILRIYCSSKPKKYIFSFFGIVDLLSILPTYLSVLFPGSQGLLVIRSIRLLRMFRILKLTRYLGESDILYHALKASRIKITVFLGAVLIIVCIAGTLMYLVENGEHGFHNIPQSIYWSIVTVTTVGYGDIAPVTVLGKFVASILMIAGYGIIAVPTGIVSAELAKLGEHSKATCCNKKHLSDAVFCRTCGEKL